MSISACNQASTRAPLECASSRTCRGPSDVSGAVSGALGGPQTAVERHSDGSQRRTSASTCAASIIASRFPSSTF